MNDTNYKYSKYMFLFLALITRANSTLTDNQDSQDNDLIPDKIETFSESISNTDLNSFTKFEGVNPANPIFIFMCIVYILSTLTAIFSNLIVLLVYKFGFRATTDLTLYLVNLAVADFLMSTVCMPFTFAQALLSKWYF